MAAWLIALLSFVALWGLWVWLGLIFDAISNYHRQARAAEKRSDR